MSDLIVAIQTTKRLARTASARERATFQYWYYAQLALHASDEAAAMGIEALSLIVSTTSEDCAALRAAAWHTVCAARKQNLEKELKV